MLRVLTVVCMLSLVNPVFAGSAWVLWVQDSRGSDPHPTTHKWRKFTQTWRVLGASPQEADCQRKLRDAMEDVKNPESIPENEDRRYHATDTTIEIIIFP